MDTTSGPAFQAKAMKLVQFVVALVLIMLSVYIYKVWVATPAFPSGLKTDAMKAVFLKDKQVYFGTVKVANKDFIVIEEPYYMQTQQVLQEPVKEGEKATSKTKMSVVPLGATGMQLHSPEKAMYIPWENIAYIENMTDSGAISKAIKDYVDGKTSSDTNTNANTNTNTPAATNVNQ